MASPNSPVLPLIRTESRRSNSLPSVPEFHQVNLRVSHFENPVRFADYHRRFGLSPTPEHVVLLMILTNPALGIFRAFANRFAG